MPIRILVPIALLALAGAAAAADPVTVELPERAAVKTAVVTIGDVGRVSGGDAATRDRIARLDVAEFKSRDQSASVTRKAVEFRIQLAGIDPSAVRVSGPEKTTLTVTRRAVSADEVTTAVRWEVQRHFGAAADGAVIELAQPISVKLPEVPAGERVVIAARPHGGRVVGQGRNQVDVTISANGENLLSFGVTVDVRPAAAAPVAQTGGVPPPAPVTPAGGVRPAVPAQAEVLVRARQRVKIQVVSGALTVTAVGEAQQDGRQGQNILVQNVDSKKVLTARVTGPGVVEVELGGGP